jgi:hypothetical protein
VPVPNPPLQETRVQHLSRVLKIESLKVLDQQESLTQDLGVRTDDDDDDELDARRRENRARCVVL